MKVTYVERIEHRTAFSRKMYCPHCGSHEYDIVEQLEPVVPNPWYIQCSHCEYEGEFMPTRDLAITQWKLINT